jgi:hypothetical protein
LRRRKFDYGGCNRSFVDIDIDIGIVRGHSRGGEQRRGD